MQHQVFGADDRGAVQFAAECHDRFFPDRRVQCRQVHEVIDVNGERRQIETLPHGAQTLDVVRIGRARAPHTRTGREDLKCVRAQGAGLEARVFQRFRARGMVAPPGAAENCAAVFRRL
jgi:hypothetical protein